MEPPSHHELLCVTPDATPDEIRASYRRLIRIYHPDVAGEAGIAMTRRLNDAQEALLNPDAARAHTPPSRPSATRAPSASFQREWAPPHRTRPTAPKKRTSAEWMIVAAIAVGVIVVSTIAVLAFTYSGPIGFNVRVLPAVIMALVWLTGGLRKPPMAGFLLLGFGILIWPLSAAGVEPLTIFASTIPAYVWVLLTVSFAAVIALRTAAPRAAWPRHGKTA
jgi:hypothetical protein